MTSDEDICRWGCFRKVYQEAREEVSVVFERTRRAGPGNREENDADMVVELIQPVGGLLSRRCGRIKEITVESLSHEESSRIVEEVEEGWDQSSSRSDEVERWRSLLWYDVFINCM